MSPEHSGHFQLKLIVYFSGIATVFSNLLSRICYANPNIITGSTFGGEVGCSEKGVSIFAVVKLGVRLCHD